MSEAGEDTTICSNCGKAIARSAISLHEVHCQRNFIKCNCGEVIKKSDRDSHLQSKHASVLCPDCSQSYESYQSHHCPKPLQLCQYCEAQIRFDDFREHVKQCGNRTQQCGECKAFIPLHDYDRHVKAGNCLPPLPTTYPSVPRRPGPSPVWPPVANNSGEFGSSYYPEPYSSVPVAIPTVVSPPYRSTDPQPSFFSGPNVSGPYRLDDPPPREDREEVDIEERMLQEAIKQSLTEDSSQRQKQEEEDRLYAERLQAMGSLPQRLESQGSDEVAKAVAESMEFEKKTQGGLLSYPGMDSFAPEPPYESEAVEDDEDLQRAIRESLRDQRRS